MEQWKPIAGLEGKYEVSNLGNIRNSKTGRVLSQRVRDGYKRINLKDENGKCLTRQVHQLVAAAFIKNPFSYTQVNHKDENRLNNVVSNLEWCSLKYNINYGTRTMRQAQSKSKAGHTVKICQLSKDGKQIREFNSIMDASRLTGISYSAIEKALHGYRMSAGGYVWTRI